MLKNKNGFTIIEVVLVLAIAGLIFLMVFVALPALQRSQRDTARKNDVSMVIDAIKRWQSNNKGRNITSMGVSAVGDDYEDKIEGVSGLKTVSAIPNGPLDSYLSIKDQVNDNKTSQLSINTERVILYTSETSTATSNKMYLPYDFAAPPVHRISAFMGYECPTGSGGTTFSGKTYVVLTKKNKGVFSVVAFLEGGGFYCQNA